MNRHPLLAVGSTAVRRDVFNGRVWTQAPTRVLRADEASVTAALWPGVRTRSSKDFIASREAGNTETLRLGYLDSLAAGDFELGEWIWRWNSFVTDVVDGRWFTVTRMFDESGPLNWWYVNFERPPVWRGGNADTREGRGAGEGGDTREGRGAREGRDAGAAEVPGWDTFDLVLDLVVEPGGDWWWKDEDEYAHCRRLGLVSAAEHVEIERAREQAVALVESRTGVFAEDPHGTWLPDPAWPRPELPSP